VPLAHAGADIPDGHCRLIIELAAQLGIELLFQPPYSPNLNLIERLGKFVKNETL